jgi:hypothetical protein
MSVKLNQSGLEHASSLMSQGKVNKDADWSFSAEDGDALLGANGDDWKNYGWYFLGEDTSAAEATKDRYKYPYGKNGEVYRSALTAIRQRAAQQNETDIFDAAGELLDKIDNANGSIQHLNALRAENIVATGNKGKKEVGVLVDTGASQSFVTRAIAEMLGSIHKLPNVLKFLLGDRSEFSVTDGITLSLEMAGKRIMDTFLVVEQGVADVVLGESTMRKFGLKIDLEHGYIFAPAQEDLKLINNQNQKEIQMKQLLAIMCAAFAVQETATEAELISKFNEMHTASKNLQPLAAFKSDVFTALGLKPESTIEEAKGKIVAVSSNGNTLQALTQELSQLKKEQLDGKFNAVIEKAMASGRITPAQKADVEFMTSQRSWADRSFATFETYFTTSAPVIVPIGEIKLSDESNKRTGLTQEDLTVASMLGNTKELLEKHNKAS